MLIVMQTLTVGGVTDFRILIVGLTWCEKVENELKYLEIAISKTAGPREGEAWGWLMAKVDAWQAAKTSGRT